MVGVGGGLIIDIRVAGNIVEGTLGMLLTACLLGFERYAGVGHVRTFAVQLALSDLDLLLCIALHMTELDGTCFQQ